MKKKERKNTRNGETPIFLFIPNKYADLTPPPKHPGYDRTPGFSPFTMTHVGPCQFACPFSLAAPLSLFLSLDILCIQIKTPLQQNQSIIMKKQPPPNHKAYKQREGDQDKKKRTKNNDKTKTGKKNPIRCRQPPQLHASKILGPVRLYRRRINEEVDDSRPRKSRRRHIMMLMSRFDRQRNILITTNRHQIPILILILHPQRSILGDIRTHRQLVSHFLHERRVIHVRRHHNHEDIVVEGDFDFEGRGFIA
jgi:hypothetical protein